MLGNECPIAPLARLIAADKPAAISRIGFDDPQIRMMGRDIVVGTRAPFLVRTADIVDSKFWKNIRGIVQGLSEIFDTAPYEYMKRPQIFTPGALDNATGVIVLLLLAELLQDQTPSLIFELVALNGEDYYSAPGEVHYLKNNPNKLQDVHLGINFDGAGYLEGDTAYSLYDCPPEIAGKIHNSFPRQEGFIEGEQWFQSDHSLFIMNNRPALAITSENFTHLSTYITHTAKDAPELVDPAKLVMIAMALKKLLLDLDNQPV